MLGQVSYWVIQQCAPAAHLQGQWSTCCRTVRPTRTFQQRRRSSVMTTITTTTTSTTVALTGAVRDIYNLLTAPQTVSSVLKWPGRNRVEITCNTSSAYHAQHVVSHVVQRDSSAIQFDRVEILSILALAVDLCRTPCALRQSRGHRRCCLSERRRMMVGCLTSQQHASVSQGRICSDSFMCCHAKAEVADSTFYLT